MGYQGCLSLVVSCRVPGFSKFKAGMQMVPIGSLYVEEKGPRTSRERRSAGNFLGLSLFLRSQRSLPGPLFMWDLMLFHFPLVILLPWRELDSWYNYMLGQFPVKVTPDCHRLPPADVPVPVPTSTAPGQKPSALSAGPLTTRFSQGTLH